MKLGFLKKMAVKLEQKKDPVFSLSPEEQRQYLDSLKVPRNDFERSYNQFCCQMKYNGKATVLLLNCLSLPLLIYYYFRRNPVIAAPERFDAVFFSEGISEEVIPDSLRREFPKLLNQKEHQDSFSKEDKKYFNKIIKKYPFSWHFLLKCLIKLRIYSYEIFKHRPKAIIVCGEYSFTSSILTNYCEMNSVLHIDVMHGEKLFFMRDSFFRFHACYVWDEHYKNLFIQLGAESSQFRIEVPTSLRFGKDRNVPKNIDYTYYLGAEKGNILKTIVEAMVKLQNEGYRVAIRPHPRYSDIDEIKKIASVVEIEDTGRMKIEDSLLRTKNAVAVYSTVLNQAFYNGVGVVIDDVSNYVKYKKLRDIQYIMLSKKHDTLSGLLEKKK